MGIIFKNCSIRGIDVSGYNDEVNWSKVKDSGISFSGIRSGYGRTTDNQFKTNWTNAKGKVLRMNYWYLDYYSNWYNPTSPAFGKSDEAWGKEQADNCWKLMKDDPESSIVWLDIESGHPSYSPTITNYPSRVYAMAKAFLERMDYLNNKFNGIYCSMGLLSWFSTWFRNRPLWVAWYNEYQTPASVLRNAKANGWTGKVLIWQYASDGDATDDGIGDGISLGNPYKWLDLNWWVGTEDDYKAFSNNFVVVAPPTPEDGGETDPEPEPWEPLSVLYSAKVVVANLNVRSSPAIANGNVLRTVGNVILPIYKEENGFGKISATNEEWISINSKYTKKLVPIMYSVTAKNGLNIRSKPSVLSTKLGLFEYGDQIQISLVEGMWGMLYGRDGYVYMSYVKKV